MKILFFIIISIPFLFLVYLLFSNYKKMVKNRDTALKQREKLKNEN